MGRKDLVGILKKYIYKSHFMTGISAQRGCEISIAGDTQNSIGQDPEQL